MSLIAFQCRHQYPAGFDLDIQFESRHSVTSLFGPSGSGKTTILEMIAGVRTIEEGRIRIGENLLEDTALGIRLSPEKRNVGLAFQDQLLFPHLSVEQNLGFAKSITKNYKQKISILRVVSLLELNPLLNRYPNALSGGEKQRVALGRALLSHPKLLLLDEPLTALDENLKGKILTYLERVIEEWNIPALFVSHSQAEVRRLAQWVVVLDQGRVICEGTPEEALSNPQAMAWKGTFAPENMLKIDSLELKEHQNLGRLGDQFLQLPPLEAGITAPIYIRFSPEAVILSPQDVQQVSARNQLHGIIRQRIDLPDGSFVAIDVGQFFWVKITPQSLTELNLKEGSEVSCLIKTQSLHLLG